MRYMFQTIVAVSLLAGGSCVGENALNSYSSNEIRQLELADSTPETLSIAVRPMLETAFFLAGANVEEVDGQIVLTLVRCKLNNTCDVSAAAEFEPGTNKPHTIRIANPGKPVSVQFDDGVQRVVYTPG